MAATPESRWIRMPLLLMAAAVWLGAPASSAQSPSEADIVSALQDGGHVIVISNGRSAAEPPQEERDRSPANLDGERELDAYGQGEMAVVGYAFRELDIPVGQTLSGTAYRSRQSAKYFGLGEQTAVDSLADNADASWLEQRVTEAPTSGENTVLVTDRSLIAKAFGRDAGDLGTAETLIFRPRDGGADLVARLSVEEWAKLAVD